MSNTQRTKEEIKAIKQGLEHYFPFEAGFTTSTVFINDYWSDMEGFFGWKGRDDYFATLSEVTGIQSLQDIKKATFILEELEKKASEPEEIKPPEQPVAATPDQIGLEEKIEAQEKLVAEQTRRAKSDQVVRDAITRKKEIYEEEQQRLKQNIAEAQKVQAELDGKKIYAKIEIPEAPALTEKEQQDLQLLKDLAKKEPKRLVEDFSTIIEEKITPTLKDLSPEEVKIIAKSSAVDIVEKLNPPDSYTPISTQTAILNTVYKDTEVLAKTGISEKAVKSTKNGSIAIALHNSNDINKQISMILLRDKYTENLYGPSPNQVVVTLSEIPQEGFHQEIDLGQLNQNSIEFQSNQNLILNTTRELGTDQIRTVLLDRASTAIEGRISTLSADNTIKRLYSFPEVQSVLANYGLASSATTITWEGVGFAGKFVSVFPQTGPLFSIAGRITGKEFVKPVISTGIKQVGGQVAKEGGKALGKVGAGVAVKKGLGGIISKAIAFVTGAPGGPLGWLLTFLGAEVLSKIGSWLKQWWTKNKDNIKPILALGVGALVLPFFGGGAALGTGLVAYGIMAGPARLALAGAGFIGGIRYLFRNLIGPSIIAPIAITMLVLPVLVAFIMFVINSGAYLVPPTPLTLSRVGQVVSPYIDVKKEITSVTLGNGSQITYNSQEGIPNNQLPVTVTYKVTITAKKGPLSNIGIADTCSVRKESGSPACPSPNPAIPTTIENGVSPTTPESFEFQMQFGSSTYFDSRTTNTITITADVPEQSGVTAAGSASLRIGDPPEDCPADWPVYPEDEPYLEIYQGPHTSGGTHDVIEAIDIFSPDEPLNLALIGNLVKATHTGTVIVGGGGNYGRYVDVTSDCTRSDGTVVQVTSRYAHLSAISSGLVTGQSIGKDEVLGLAGSSGTAYPHLHYEFRPAPGPVPMDPPYIPISVPDGCFNAGGKPCNVRY